MVTLRQSDGVAVVGGAALKHILIVDDEEAVCWTLQRALAREGHSVAVAASADDGLFDSTAESFTLNLPALTSGKHTIEVQTMDRAGNTATQTVTVTVS